LKLIFTSNNIVAIFDQQPATEKLYKFPFEQVDFVAAGHPDPLEYPMMVSVLTKNLYAALLPHTLLSSKVNELRFEFSPGDGLTLRSREEQSFSSTSRLLRNDFYEYSIITNCQSQFCGFTLIKSEFVGLVSGAEKSESLLKLYFGVEGAPVLVKVNGCGDGVAVSCIMSPMTENVASAPSLEEQVFVDESSSDIDGDLRNDDKDEFAIPGTPDYVY
jgi:hypothetical protein